MLKQQMKDCEHNPNVETSSLIKLPKRYLVNPEIVDYYCPLCHSIHRYKKEGTTLVPLMDSKE